MFCQAYKKVRFAGDLKKVRFAGDLKKVRFAGDLKKVAEMVLVLAAMGKMRGGRRPTAVEVEMVAEAREKLVEVCEKFAPKDVFHRDVFGTVIEDLGFGRLREMKLGVLPPKMSIAQKLQLAKQKLPTSEVRPVGSGVLTSGHLGRGSTASPIDMARRPHLRSDGLSNANSVGDHKASHTPTWSTQSQSVSFNNAGLNNGPAHLTNINHHRQHQMNFGQPPAVNTHNKIAKVVQKILHPHKPDHHKWNPPSRDYVKKALTCQTCKSMMNEVDNVLVCDACEKGYHLRCLQCNPKSILGDECREWYCAKCLALNNGKPLPLKYGRVMRNINTPKKSDSSSGVQPSLEKKVQLSDENFNQRLMSANGDSVSQTSTDVQISGAHECGTENFSSEKCQSSLQTSGNCQDADVCLKPSTQNGIKLESNLKGESGKSEVVEEGSSVKTSENCTIVRENDGPLPSSIHDIEWVGGVINEFDGKMY